MCLTSLNPNHSMPANLTLYRLEITLAILTTRSIQDSRFFLIHEVRHDKCHITWQETLEAYKIAVRAGVRY